jgi:cobaltochelatase CobN
VSSAPVRIRLLVAASTAEDPSWVAWLAARDASPQASRIVLQRVSRKGDSGSQPAVGLGLAENLRWFGPVDGDDGRRSIIEYAEQALAAGSFPPLGAELQTKAWSVGTAKPAGAAGGAGAAEDRGATGRIGAVGGMGAAGHVDAGSSERAAAHTSAAGLARAGGVADAGALSGAAESLATAVAVRNGVVLLSHADTDLLALRRAVEELPAGFPPVVGYSLNGVATPGALSELVAAGPAAKLVVIVRVHGAANSVPGLIELVAEADREGWHVVVISGVAGLTGGTGGVAGGAANIAGGAGVGAAALPRTSGVAGELAASLTAYFMAGGVQNVLQAVRRVAHELLGIPAQFDAPKDMPAHGLYHPDFLVTTPAEWEGYRAPGKPAAVVLFYRAHVLSGNLQFVDQLVRALEFRGFAAVGVFTSSLRDRDESGAPAALQLLAPPAVIVNTVSYPVFTLTSLERPPQEAQLTPFETMGMPIVQAICCGSARSAWSESARGLGPAEAAMNVALPECDGRVITVPISFKENHRYVPDGERIGRVADLARRFAALRATPNHEKRVAIVLSNSGGKAQKVGGAVGLDTPASLLQLLSAMRDSGYDVGALPGSADELMSVLLARGCYDEKSPLDPASAWRLPRSAYVTWFSGQSAAFKRSLRDAWGEPSSSGPTLPPPFWRGGKQSARTPLLVLQEPHADRDDYLFSGVAFGNVIVAIQPPRGFGFDQETMYHSPDLPPCHHYAAFYRWLAEGWRSDAMIHFGTHGTLEWLPGKSLAMSADCAPDTLLGDLPLFYPFVVNNPGEGAQAKRRAHAVIIDHLVPPLTQAQMYGPLAALTRLVEEYYRAESLDPGKLTVLRGQIWDLVRTERLEDDLKQIRRERHGDHVHSWDDRISEQGVPRALESLSGRGFAHLLEDLDAYLCDLGRAQIRDGLHVFGVAPAGAALIDLMFAVLYSPNAGVPSLVEAVREACGITPAALRERRGVWPDAVAPALSFAPGEVVTVGQVRTAVEHTARGLLEQLAERGFSGDVVDAVIEARFGIGHGPARGAVDELKYAVVAAGELGDAVVAGDGVAGGSGGTPGAVENLRTTLRFACDVLAPNLARTTDETRNLLAALDGRYVPAGPSGAPSRGMAHVLPTGRNFYTVDPRGLPTPAAWTTGVALADAALQQYFDEVGRWPESVALSVWGTPTMRTGGDDIAQALAMLGVRPVWEPVTRRTCGIEVIPLPELNRPRIDVTLRVSGFFRDAFPALMHLFDEAVQRVVMLDEPIDQNFVRKHWLAETAALISTGLDSGTASRRASYRVFSSKPGAYGTGTMDAIENRTWRDTADLADVVIAWGGWAYGSRTAHGSRGVNGSAAPNGSGVADGSAAADGVEDTEAFRRRLADVELALHNRDNREQDLLDSSDHFEYHGGLIAAVGSLSGEQPRAYVGDSSDSTRPDVRTLKGEMLRVLRSRVINPKWLAGIQRHGYRGGLEMAATVDSLFGFAATAGVVTDWMFETVAENYAMGSSREFLERSNPWALNAIAERLLEAEQRHLWTAKGETLEALRSVLLTSEATIEEHAEAYT